jgi:hypothetical protein
MKLYPLAVLTFAALPILGCSDGGAPAGSASAAAASPSGKSSAASSTKSAAPMTSAASATPSANAPAAAMVEVDLSTADPAWKGWVMMGPKEAKVLADGVHGARVAANGMDAFDVAFGTGKPMLKTTKSGVEAGAKASSAKVTFTTDTADKLEWTTEVGSTKSYNFIWAIKASGKDMTCNTNAGMGVSSESMLAEIKAACGTLQKK